MMKALEEKMGESFTAIFALIAAAAAGITAWATWRQIGGLKSALQAETLLKLLDRFDSVPFRERRRTAATACLSQGRDPAGAALDDVLDFFDDTAFLVKKGAPDEEMMWHGFYHWIRLYLQAGEQYITSYRRNEPAVWKHLFSLYPRLNALEKAEGQNVYIERLNELELRKQLEQEII
jgi:hypothetical protein